MKIDKLESFILREREHFDQGVPNPNVWDAIEQKLDNETQNPPTRRVQLWSFVRVAAAVLALLVAGGIIGSYITQMRADDPSLAIQEIAPELSELEAYYNQEVSQRMQQLATYDEDQAVVDDLRELDTTMNELKEDLLHAPKGSEEQIIGAIIKSYQTKIAILERVLNRIHSKNPKIAQPKDNEISI